ncbi:MAG: S9 family peptidase [Thermoanaerobaculaceae bacterium]|nr:S9 family peptidase [Thermoanaerobaculaceae bacterium]MDI9620978.1 S9 family peptidase [Acidobacteriota bacterium]NLH09708.1 S9 family peptidase [Holophagae bacterium]HPW56371.1 S9 family peptidase [Thermoanaerobaculaceae bacterium]
MFQILALALLLPPAANVSAPAQAASSAAAISAQDLPHPFSVHDLLAMERITDPQVSPDGTRIAFSLRVTDLEANKGRNDIWVCNLDGSNLRNVTGSSGGNSNARWSGDGKTLLFLSTRSGSQQVWQTALEGGEPKQLTHEPLDVENFEMAPGGRRFVFSMAVLPGRSPEQTKAEMERRAALKASGRIYDHLFVRHWDTWKDGTRNHLFSFDPASGRTVDLMPQMDADAPSKPFGGSDEFAFAVGGKSLVFSARNLSRGEPWSTNFDLFKVELDEPNEPIVFAARPAWDTQPRFSPDGTRMAYLAMSRPGYEADRYDIVVRDLATNTERVHTLRAHAGRDGDRSPSELVWSADSKELYCTADHLGQHSLFALDPTTGTTRIVVEKGTISSPQPLADGRIVFLLNSLQGPNEIYVTSRSGDKVERVTRLNDHRVGVAKTGRAEQFSFTGAKGDTVYGYLVYPAHFVTGQKYPVAFIVHGGPQGSMGNDFHYRWNPNVYAGAGYAAVMIDFHGSTGYGQAFTDAINGDWGGAPYEDLMKGLDYALGKYPFLDGTRVGALGASYGGYMINWIAGQTDRFKALVCHDGNLDERFAYFDTEELWFPEWEHGGPPWKSGSTYGKHNPIDHVSKWKTPMLVIHGQLDFRIPYAQGLATFTALQRQGIPSRLLIFPDENHWVLKPANSILWHQTVLGWLADYVMKAQ